MCKSGASGVSLLTYGCVSSLRLPVEFGAIRLFAKRLEATKEIVILRNF
jgi:hypothetical protein